MTGGIFLPVVGPAGAGKDDVIEGVRRYYVDDRRVVFPRRTITAAEQRMGEVHCAATPGQFQLLMRDGAFSLVWDWDGAAYALPASVDADLAAGRVVVAEVGRAALLPAAAHFRRMHVIEVTASPEVIARRRAVRALRELDEMTSPWPEGVPVTTVFNDGLPEAAVAGVVALIEQELSRRLPKRAPQLRTTRGRGAGRAILTPPP